MSSLGLLSAMRAVHIVTGVFWVGSILTLAFVILPLSLRSSVLNEPRGTAAIERRIHMLSGIAAVLNIIAGIYLFAVLHSRDTTSGGLLLKIGAAAALLSLPVGMLGRRLGPLANARLTSAFLLISLVAMSLFRYAG